jgi:hypothetical protein
VTSELRARYTRLLRWYPAAYRAERGAEIVDTYLDLAPAGRRWPRPGDVVDLVAGGLRQRLRARDALGLADALPLAGTIALTAATVLATVWLILTEAFPYPGEFAGAPTLGPFHTLAVLAWIAWLIVLPAGALGCGRWAVAVAVAVTIGVAGAVAVVPAMELTSFHEPNLSVLAPQLVLGVLALAVPRRHSYRDTATFTAFAIAAGAATALVGSRYHVRYDVLLGAMMLLVVVLVATGVVLTARRDRRAWWPALLLLGPAWLLGSKVGMSATGQPSLWDSRRWAVAWTATSLLVAAVALVTAVRWRTRRARHTRIVT